MVRTTKYVLFPGCFLLYVKIMAVGYVTGGDNYSLKIEDNLTIHEIYFKFTCLLCPITIFYKEAYALTFRTPILEGGGKTQIFIKN